ncbi:MAG: response regulator [Polyangiales bacterium]
MMSPKQATVLVVDDDDDLRTMVETILEDAGYVVRRAGDGVEALEQLAQMGRPDLILLDMRMPRMDGWELGRRVRSQYGREIPIVVMTAAEHAEKQAQEIDADAFVAKPFDIDNLLGVIARNLRS